MEQETPTPQPAPGGVEGLTAGLGPDASWRWPEERWRAVVNKVRAGRPLRPATWPHGAQVAVALSFDVDQETSTLRDGKTSPALLAQGEYGSRAGLPRILKMLDRHTIPASFYVPGVSALLQILLFVFLRNFDVKVAAKTQKQVIIQLEQIPETRQERRPPPAARPVVPIASDKSQVADETTIETTDIDIGLGDLAPPPVLEERVVEKVEVVEDEEPVEIWKVEKQPEVVKQVKPDYPEIARKAGIEGRVTVNALVGKTGKVEKIGEVSGPEVFHEVAKAAALQWEFTPAIQNDRPVKVWVAIPFNFSFRD
jgi:TonB family protein